ncbi:Cupredoxin [Lactifluus volemus]|nr:Cupredoxin [Lactifluus volemus]
MHFRSFFLLTIISLAGEACAMERSIAPDGFTRSATVVQQRVSVQLRHWHGIHQSNTDFEDGTTGVTQCPLIPGESFEYIFLRENKLHFKAQYCDGLRGPLVIYDPDDPHRSLYDIDNADTVITLADWYHYLSTNAPVNPKFNSTLINGKGRYPGGPAVPLTVVNVQKGSGHYRFRLPHMTIIEADGNNVQPLVVDSIQIFAGQRYSSLSTQTNRLIIITTRPHNLAILRYNGASDQDPSIDPTKTFRKTDLHPLVPTPVPGKPFRGGADININLVNLTNFFVNGVSFVSPTVELTIPAGAAGGFVSSECNRTVIVILMRAAIY